VTFKKATLGRATLWRATLWRATLGGRQIAPVPVFTDLTVIVLIEENLRPRSSPPLPPTKTTQHTCRYFSFEQKSHIYIFVRMHRNKAQCLDGLDIPKHFIDILLFDISVFDVKSQHPILNSELAEAASEDIYSRQLSLSVLPTCVLR
jgi:hypothetical protein